MKITLKNDAPKYDLEASEIEHQLFRQFEDKLRSHRFQYLSIPSIVNVDTIVQSQASESLYIDESHMLAGSPAQGILEYLEGKDFSNIEDPINLYATITCFRSEDEMSVINCMEFKKMEMFSIVPSDKSKFHFELMVDMPFSFLKSKGIECRKCDVTDTSDVTYKNKTDIEVYTKKYGWIETHSITNYGSNQKEHFDLKGDVHTIAGTAMSSPRILIPYLENSNLKNRL